MNLDDGRPKNKKIKPLKRSEQETVINFVAGSEIATVFTRDPSVIRKFSTLVNEYPDIYRIVSVTDYDITYEMPKKYVSYRGPRKLTAAQREHRKEMMEKININKKQKK